MIDLITIETKIFLLLKGQRKLEPARLHQRL